MIVASVSVGMHCDHRTIREKVKTVREGHGEEIAVVICSNGKYGISRNGTLMPALEWPGDQLAECIAFAERFSQTNSFFDDGDFAPTAK